MTKRRVAGACVILAVWVSGCVQVEIPVEESVTIPEVYARLADAPSRFGAKDDEPAARASARACENRLWRGRPGASADETNALIEVLGACRALALLQAEGSSRALSVGDASIAAIDAANAVVESLPYHDEMIGGLPIWTRAASASDDPEKVSPCAGDAPDPAGACVDEGGRLLLGDDARPEVYRANFAMHDAMARMADDPAWQDDVNKRMRLEAKVNLAMFGVAVVSAVVFTYTGVSSIVVGVSAFSAGGALWPLVSGVGGGATRAYAVLQAGLSAIGRAKMAMRGELPMHQYVSCRCAAPDQENRYHTGKIGWWKRWRDFDDAELASRCYGDAIGWAGGYDEGSCDVIFLR